MTIFCDSTKIRSVFMYKNYDLIIFDWDGTLADSTGKIVDALDKTAEGLGLERLDNKQYKQIIGLGLDEALLALWPTLNEKQLVDVKAFYSDYFVNKSQMGMPFYAGAIDLLTDLNDSQLKLAVATGKSRKGLDRIFHETGIGSRFHASRCADETKSKPHPLMLNEILEQLKVSADRALMVGDTSFDLEMAALAGMDSVGLSHGAHENHQLHPHQPLDILDSLHGLNSWLFSRS